MKRISAVLTAGIIGAGALGGCGGGSEDEAYCNELKSAQKQFKDVSFTDASALKDLAAEVEKVVSKAPSVVKSEWNTLADILNHPENATQADVTKLQDAGDKLRKDTKDRCDIDLNVGS
jgi:hypothetical protein